MACPICTFPIGVGVNHKLCLIRLFKANKIQTVFEWEVLCDPTTIVHGKRRVVKLPPG
jgi:hypothetical protein